MQGQRVVLMESSTPDADNGERGTNTNNASPSSERSGVQQALGSTDSSDGHLRSSSDFDAANAAAAAATAAAAGGLGDTDNPNGYHSLPSPEAAAADNALMRSMDVASGNNNTDETLRRHEPLHINHRHRHDQHIPMAPPRLLTVVPLASSSEVDPGTGTAAITTGAAAAAPDTTPHINKQFIMELIAWYRNRSWQKKLITTAFFVVACVVYADLFGLFWEDSKIHAGLELFLQWMDQNSIAASFAFVGMFILTTLMFVPPFLMTFGAGFVFVDVYGFAYGMALAMITCFLGSCIGGIIAFARARYMTRELVKLFAKRYPIIGAVDKALKRSGFKVMLLLRLCSIIPFSALNYIGGVTGVQLSSFVNSMVGIIPSQLLTVFLGATAGSFKNTTIAESWKMSNIVWLSVTGACGLFAIIVTIYFARKEIKKELSREDTESLNPDSVRSSTGMASQASDDFEINETAADRERKSEEWWWIWA